MTLDTPASESEEKDVNKCMFAGKICLTDCVWKITQMVFILLMKNVAVDEGRGVIVISNIVTYYYNINIHTM